MQLLDSFETLWVSWSSLNHCLRKTPHQHVTLLPSSQENSVKSDQISMPRKATSIERSDASFQPAQLSSISFQGCASPFPVVLGATKKLLPASSHNFSICKIISFPILGQKHGQQFKLRVNFPQAFLKLSKPVDTLSSLDSLSVLFKKATRSQW